MNTQIPWCKVCKDWHFTDEEHSLYPTPLTDPPTIDHAPIPVS